MAVENSKPQRKQEGPRAKQAVNSEQSYHYPHPRDALGRRLYFSRSTEEETSRIAFGARPGFSVLSVLSVVLLLINRLRRCVTCGSG